MLLEFYLPFPPTINNYYVKTQRGVFISSKGKKFRQDCINELYEQIGDRQASGDHLLVEVILFPPDLRKRDLDNYMKPLLDAITHSKLIWDDDVLIDQLFIYRGKTQNKGNKKGCTFVSVQPSGPIIPVGGSIP
jgi:crossover junction endodeoxyribonuclease RusA